MGKYYPVVVLESRSRRESKVPYFVRKMSNINLEDECSDHVLTPIEHHQMI